MFTIKNLRTRKSWKSKFSSYSLARSYLRSYIKKANGLALNAKYVSIRDYGFGINKLA